MEKDIAELLRKVKDADQKKEDSEEEKRSYAKMQKMVASGTNHDQSIYDKHAMILSAFHTFSECWPECWGAASVRDAHLAYLKACYEATGAIITATHAADVMTHWRAVNKACQDTRIGTAARRLLDSVAKERVWALVTKQ